VHVTLSIGGDPVADYGDDDPSLLSLVDEPERSIPVLQSYWYDNRGRTLDRFRYNQFAFVAGGRRYLHRRDRWLWAPISAATGPEPAFQLLDPGVVPLFEPVDSAERLRWLQNAFQEYATFSSDVLAA